MASINLPRFLQKLQSVVKEVPQHVGGWNVEGTEFEIRHGSFESEHLPKYFKGSRSTFIRQLHFYGFKKLDSQGGFWAFSHPKFLRDSPHLIYEIRRKTRAEDSGPASKEEVQALRTQMENMKQYMLNMENTLIQVQAELHEVKRQNINLKSRSSSSASSHDLKRLRSESDTVDQSANMLPFVDGSNSGSFYNEALEDFSHSFENDSDDDLKKTKKVKRVDTSASIDDIFPFDDDFTDLFVGLPTLDTPTGKETEEEEQCTIFLKSPTKDIPMTNEMFAGFLSRYVETTVLLSKRNVLNQEADPELEVYVHQNLPEQNPFKELLSHAPSQVRTVLIHLLSDAASLSIFSGMDRNTGASSPRLMVKEPFSRRPLVSFVTNNCLTDVSGECFIQFLSFLLQSSVEDNPSEPVPKAQFNSPFFQTFQPYFSSQVNRIMVKAKNSLEEFKRSMGQNTTCHAPQRIH